MQTKAKKVAPILFGWSFIMLGVIGLFLPVLQGVLFLLIGLFILSTEYVWAHRLLLRIQNRFPAVALQWEQVASRSSKWVCRVGRVFQRTGQ
ncbi:MAG TPA: PGPGW domain-containing protein [Candidatus Bathyarchaeia archaeon]|nr:PGPGW domain-containing protein [Candidatus Bathyarchaeia archaeon]